MKLAESARSHWVIALATVAFSASAIIAASQMCAKSRATEKVVTKAPVKQWRGCHQRKAKPAPPAKKDVTGSDYRDVLFAAKPAFEACTKGQPEGVTYEVRMPIGGDGHVMSVEVRGTSPDIANVSMKVVKCLEKAVTKLQFPATGYQTFVSTNIRTE